MKKIFGKKGMAKKFVESAIAVVIGVAMIPAIVSGVNSVLPNVSGTALILVGLVTFLFVAGLLMAMMNMLMKK